MSRSQRPKKCKATPVGKTATLHSFFGSTSQLTQIQTPPQSTEIIIIGSEDENHKTSPTQQKRKAPGNLDPESLPSDSKKGKVAHSTAKSVTEDDSALKHMPLSSLNRTITVVEAELYVETNETQEMISLVGDWEMGDDELLDIADDSRVVDNGEDGPENLLDTCPVCGAIFVDFCLSVSPTPSPWIMLHVHAPLFSNYKHM
jgi:hypothetical protein